MNGRGFRTVTRRRRLPDAQAQILPESDRLATIERALEAHDGVHCARVVLCDRQETPELTITVHIDQSACLLEICGLIEVCATARVRQVIDELRVSITVARTGDAKLAEA